MKSGATIVLLRAVLAASLLGLATPDALAACDPSQQCCASSDSPAGSTTCGGDGVASQGNGSLVDLGAGNPINLLNGNKFQREVDLAPLPGVLGLELVRYYNSAETRTGWLGRGWRLSYESELHLRPGGLEIVQPDGRRIAFTQGPQQLDSYHPGSPTQGGVRAERKQEGTEYTWTWADGRELRFNTRGKLASISLPTGESVSLRYDDKGRLTEVVDPAGRRLSLYYLDQVDQASARRGERFRGVQHIDTPVGRFAYEYGSALPEGSSAPPRRLLANLVKVHSPTGEEPTQRKPTLHGLAPYEPQRPAAAESGTAATRTAATTAADSTATTRTTTSAPGISRSYHYEDPRFPTLLTGISVEGKGSDGQRSQQRLSTWAYDAQRRAILSVRGERPAQGSGTEGNGTRDNGARGSGTSGSGLEQVTLQWLPPQAGTGPDAADQQPRPADHLHPYPHRRPGAAGASARRRLRKLRAEQHALRLRPARAADRNKHPRCGGPSDPDQAHRARPPWAARCSSAPSPGARAAHKRRSGSGATSTRRSTRAPPCPARNPCSSHAPASSPGRSTACTSPTTAGASPPKSPKPASARSTTRTTPRPKGTRSAAPPATPTPRSTAAACWRASMGRWPTAPWPTLRTPISRAMNGTARAISPAASLGPPASQVPSRWSPTPDAFSRPPTRRAWPPLTDTASPTCPAPAKSSAPAGSRAMRSTCKGA